MAHSDDPVFYDFLYRQKRKGNKWREVEQPHPALEGAVADTHCHLHMTPDPAFALARCAYRGVDFVTLITDPSEDGLVVFEKTDEWVAQAKEYLAQYAPDRDLQVPRIRISVGCHPHNAKLYDDAMEQRLIELLKDPRVNAVGEIGLDYHYDLSPREDQRRVFQRQVEIAHEANLPVSLHLRDAHDEALEIMEKAGWPKQGTLLHCCTVGPDQIDPWIEAGCYIAFGGAMTFNNGEAIRQAMMKVPLDQLLTETDSPYMAPIPLRGTDCLPDFVIYTAAAMADLRRAEPGEDRARFLAALWDNAVRLLDK